MTKILAISEANAIAFHSMAVIAMSDLAINATSLSERINASKHHVSKVMQRLVKEGLIGSTRGPSGGFYLTKKPKEIMLIDILEAIEGEVSVTECPIDNAECPFGSCLMGGICYELGNKLVTYIKNNSLQDIIDNIEKADENNNP